MTKRAYRAAKARDARHQDPERPSPSNKKNTKRWCRGVIGREHDYERNVKVWQFGEGFKTTITMDKCRQCGREEYPRR